MEIIMREIVKDWILMLGLILFAVLALHTCEPKEAKSAEAPEDVALWLARSCAGEAGWGAHETGECLAIWHIYKKRSRINGKGLLWTAQKYSAAIKPRPERENRWVLHLNREGTRPKHWPRAADWTQFREDWGFILVEADAFLRGERADPLPAAHHYGSIIDRHRAERQGWKYIRTTYRNQFWRVPGAE
jgi:hypothetical protein